MTEAKGYALVTGATGFLGQRLCRRLSERGDRVLALGRHDQPGPWERFLPVDLESGSLPDSSLDGVETVYHLAGRAHAISEASGADAAYRRIIVGGTQMLVDTALSAGVKRFVYFSSVKAMGEGNPPGTRPAPIDESQSSDPQSPYGRAKAEAELRVLSAGFPHAVVLRPVLVYGPGEKGNLPRMVEAVRGHRFPPWPENGNRRSMIHVDDVVEFALRAADYPIAAGRTYILSGPDSPSTRELYNAIREALGKSPSDRSVPFFLLRAAAAGGSLLGALFRRRMPLDLDKLAKLTGSAWYSSARAEEDLGYTARLTVRDWLASGGAIA